MKTTPYTFYEFFAGGGMARAGLGKQWRCLFANDFDHKKSATYRANWGEGEILTKDIWNVTPKDLPPEVPDLVWASFPCQDLSLAGGGAGLKGDRSGTFWPFWELVKQMDARKRAPQIIVLENVLGTLTSHDGKDFREIVSAFAQLNYDVGAIVMDAELFVPQSRQRLFFIGVPSGTYTNEGELFPLPPSPWRTPGLLKAQSALSKELKARWIWWDMPAPPQRSKSFADIIEATPSGVEWHSPEETDRLLKMMAPLHKQKVQRVRAANQKAVGTVYRRMRPGTDGTIQRAEVRFDDVAGCLRTPAGGSSRQLLLIVENGNVRTRLISARETARLMGLPEKYKLPDRYNDAYHLTGDGVVVPVVRHLAKFIIEPLLQPAAGKRAA